MISSSDIGESSRRVANMTPVVSTTCSQIKHMRSRILSNLFDPGSNKQADALPLRDFGPSLHSPWFVHDLRSKVRREEVQRRFTVEYTCLDCIAYRTLFCNEGACVPGVSYPHFEHSDCVWQGVNEIGVKFVNNNEGEYEVL